MQFQNDNMLEELHLIKVNLIKDVISDLGGIEIKVFGESMLPTINEGEKLLIEPVENIEKVDVNDLVFFYDEEYILVLHRLIKKDNQFLILKGDNCDSEDVITFAHVLGKVNKLKTIEGQITKEYIKETNQFRLILLIENNELISLKLITKGEENARCR